MDGLSCSVEDRFLHGQERHRINEEYDMKKHTWKSILAATALLPWGVWAANGDFIIKGSGEANWYCEARLNGGGYQQFPCSWDYVSCDRGRLSCTVNNDNVQGKGEGTMIQGNQHTMTKEKLPDSVRSTGSTAPAGGSSKASLSKTTEGLKR